MSDFEESDNECEYVGGSEDEAVASDDETEVAFEEEPDTTSATEYSRECIVVKPQDRQTSNKLSLFEMTEVISIRSKQIEMHNNCLVETGDLDSAIKMAELELRMRKTPLIVRRHVGTVKNAKTGKMDDYYEYWSVREMCFADNYNWS